MLVSVEDSGMSMALKVILHLDPDDANDSPLCTYYPEANLEDGTVHRGVKSSYLFEAGRAPIGGHALNNLVSDRTTRYGRSFIY